jgi:hypothetical protein
LLSKEADRLSLDAKRPDRIQVPRLDRPKASCFGKNGYMTVTESLPKQGEIIGLSLTSSIELSVS